ncbi:MAG: LLM class flavin-dependent oxidoreductase [Deltaproteobacteria bacterium]|nr:LLM class flavin-dependent oxidoreductase [Deltaproteobacteria bacterium]
MKFDVFSEAQRVGPRDEGALYRDVLEQARLADELGFATWWMVEHHGAGEYSYSSAPELILAWIATQTDRIRLGHSGVLAPFKINHPIRAAERGAMLDHISGGRLEFGMARSLEGEWDAFDVEVETTRDQLVEALRMIPQMWTQERFSWNSKLLRIPERNLIPKPVQKPHPPIWSTTGSPAAFRLAGSLGIGALGNTLLTGLDGISLLLREYAAGLAECETPAGLFRNERRSVFTFVHCADSEKAAIESGACNAALWYMARMPEVFHAPADNVWELIRGGLLPNNPADIRSVESIDPESMARKANEHPVVDLVKRYAAGEAISQEEAYAMLSPLPSVLVGDPATCRKKAEGYADLGVDHLMCFMQIGDLSQEKILAGMRNVGKHLIPHFDR